MTKVIKSAASYVALGFAATVLICFDVLKLDFNVVNVTTYIFPH